MADTPRPFDLDALEARARRVVETKDDAGCVAADVNDAFALIAEVRRLRAQCEIPDAMVGCGATASAVADRRDPSYRATLHRMLRRALSRRS